MLRLGVERTLLLACFSSLTACSTIAGFDSISGEPIEVEEQGPGGPPLIWQRVAAPPPNAGPACDPVGIVMSEGKVDIAGTYLGPCDLGGGLLANEGDPNYHTFWGHFDADTGDYLAHAESADAGVHQVATGLGLTNDGIVLGGWFTGIMNFGGCMLDATGAPPTHYLLTINKNFGCTGSIKYGLDGGATATATRIATDGDAIFAGLTSSTDVTRGGLHRFFASQWQQHWLPPKDVDGIFTAPPTLNLSSTTARSGIVVVGGDILGNAVIGGMTRSATMAPDAIMIAADEVTGASLWVQQFTGIGEQNIFDMEQTFVNGVDELYVTGGFDTEITIGADKFVSVGGRDAFIARMDPKTGEVKQAFSFGDGADQNGHALAFDPVTQRVILMGGFRGKIEFQNAVVENKDLEDHLYMMIFNTELKLLSLTTYGAGGKQSIRSMFAADSNLFLTGVFFGELDFGNPATKMVNDSAAKAMFWARIGL